MSEALKIGDAAELSHSPEAYDAWYEKPFGRYADRLEKSLIFKLLPEVTRKLILDMGCGTGNYSIMLAKMEANVVSVDAQLLMLTVTRERSKKLRLDIQAVLADARALPFRRGVFDHSVSILALCFICFPRTVIGEMRRTTKQTGRVIVGTLNKWSAYGICKKTRSFFIESAYRHAIFHTPSELRTLVGATEWYSTIFGLEWMPKWLLQALYRTDDHLGRIFKPFGAFLATKAVVLTAPPQGPDTQGLELVGSCNTK
jgi:ubiquinone/menaquinone biosynthesis C-methylase UbiE